MGRRRTTKHRKGKKKRATVRTSPPTTARRALPQKGQQRWWQKLVVPSLTILLTILTGIALPFYFQYESNKSLLAITNSLATVQALQPTTTIHQSGPDAYASLEAAFKLLANESPIAGLPPIPSRNNPPPLSCNRQPTFLRIVNVLPDAGTITVFAGGGVRLQSYQSGTITPYIDIQPSEKFHIIIDPRPELTELSKTLQAAPGAAYTAIAFESSETGVALRVYSDLPSCDQQGSRTAFSSNLA